MITIHETLFIENVETINFCDKPIIYQLSVRTLIEPFETTPTKGIRHDYNNCKKCKKQHENILRQATVQFDIFPNCCKLHKNLLSKDWFDKSKIENLPLITTNKFIFTTQHIYNNLESDNWYKEITDYIEYTIFSFGTFPDENCGNPFYLSSYFDYIKRYTNNLNCTGEELKKKRIILSYLDSYFTKKEEKDFDFKLIVFYYEQWYKTFPFDLLYFQHLKERYKSIPLFTNKTETNKYLNRTKVTIHTKESLLELLINRTKKLLSEINGATLYKKGLLNDTNKVQIDLLIESRILECDTILNDDTANEKHRYLNILKKWLAGEIEFIDKLVKVLPPPQKTNSNKTESNKYSNKQIAIAYSVIGEQITKENASAILLKYSTNRNIDKLLQKRITKPSTLTVLSGNKTADSKHLYDLLSAKRLLSGMKNTKAINDIEQIITSFKTSYSINY